LPASSNAAQDAREYVSSVSHFLSSQIASNLALVVTELVTNSVRHAGLDACDVIELRLLSNHHTLRGEVADPGRGLDLSGTSSLEDGEGGFGLCIVEDLTDRWGFSGSRVWFEIDERSLLPV
jgi:two-component sensor histidine kinase